MSRSIAISILSALLAIPISTSARSQDSQVQTTQLRAISVKLGVDDIYNRIWHDEFEKKLNLRKQLAEKLKREPILTTDVFTADFKAPEGHIVMAATAVPGQDCGSYENIGLSKSLMTCPLRVALVQGDKLSVISEDDHFGFMISVNDKGEFNNEDKTYTEVTFNSAKKIIETRLIEGGLPAQTSKENLNDDVIYLKY